MGAMKTVIAIRRMLLAFVFVLVCGMAAMRAYAQTLDAGAGSAVTLVDAGVGSASGGGTVTTPPAFGSGSAIAPLPQAGGVVDPLENPAAALTEYQLAKKTGWPLAVLLILVMITHGLTYAETTSLGKWLAVDHRASIISIAGTMIATAYNTFLMGGTLTSALVAASASFFLLKNAKPKPAQQAAAAPAK